MPRVKAAIALVLVAACGRPPRDSYDRSCTADADCALVDFRESCSTPHCGPANFAVNAAEAERFTREQALECVPWLSSSCVSGAGISVAVCDAAECTALICSGDGSPSDDPRCPG